MAGGRGPINCSQRAWGMQTAHMATCKGRVDRGRADMLLCPPSSLRGARLMAVDNRPTLAAPDDDPYLWLEEIEGTRALAFVEEQSRRTQELFGGAGFAGDRDLLADIYDRPD